MGDWLNAGARLVWVIDTERGGARVYRADGTVAVLESEGQLVGEDVLLGFTLPLSQLGAV